MDDDSSSSDGDGGQVDQQVVQQRHGVMQQRHRRGGQDDLAPERPGLVPDDGVPWPAATHMLGVSRALTVADPRCSDPPGFKGHLYPPQATVLHAMCALERHPQLALGWGRVAQSRCGRINAAPAFGKTVLALALVCAQPVPAKLPELAPLGTYPLRGQASKTVNRAVVNCAHESQYLGRTHDGFLPCVTVRYSRWLPATVVVAANNVISQWEAETRRFTDKQFFTVEHVRSLREFEAKFREGALNSCDLIFIKAGRVTGNFALAGEPAHERRPTRSLLGAVSRILEGVSVARLIIDDYDTLKLSSDDCLMPALFTWFISATRRRTMARACAPLIHDGATGDPLREWFRRVTCSAFPVLGASLDDILNTTFSLNCDPAYVADHISSCCVSYRRIYVRGGRAAGVLQALGVGEAVVEMVNGDAIATAAASLGIAASSICDVIRRVVGRELDKLREALRIRTAVSAARAAIAAKAGPPDRDPHHVKDLKKAISDGEGIADAIDAITGASSATDKCLADLAAVATTQYDKHSLTLNRMRENVREGHCQCCTVPFDAGSPAYILASCCQIVVCEDCITRPINVGAREFLRRCPNCARDITPGRDLVRVGQELDLEAALRDASATEAALHDEPAAEPAPAAESVPAADAESAPAAELAPVAAPAGARGAIDALEPKERALLQLVRGEAIDCIRDTPVAPYVVGMLEGRRDVPWPAALPKKYIVFAMHAETTRKLQRVFDDFGCRYVVLKGNRDQKDAAVESFRADVPIILVTAAKDCAGLNLPFASTIVFYHQVIDRNVETQVAARGQRPGRLHNYEVVSLCNEAEGGVPN